MELPVVDVSMSCEQAVAGEKQMKIGLLQSLFSSKHMPSVKFLEDLKKFFPKSPKKRKVSPTSSQETPPKKVKTPLL